MTKPPLDIDVSDFELVPPPHEDSPDIGDPTPDLSRQEDDVAFLAGRKFLNDYHSAPDTSPAQEACEIIRALINHLGDMRVEIRGLKQDLEEGLKRKEIYRQAMNAMEDRKV